MKRAVPIAALAFAMVLCLHFGWFVWRSDTGPWQSMSGSTERPSLLSTYVAGESLWLGLSYATAAGFVGFCLARLMSGRRRAVAGLFGGITLGGFLAVAGCFLIGCCGSPMLAVWAALLGPRFLGVTGPFVFGLTLASVIGGAVWVTRRTGQSCCAADECCPAPGAGRLEGQMDTPVGPVPRAATNLAPADRLGTVKARLGIGRMHYTVPPGLYAVGEPDADAPVFVSANYKMSFDCLRSALDGLTGWIMVLDTKGINVWCAAGKGTFGTDEICARIAATGLTDVVSHRTLILPQLGAPGVAAHEVKSRTGFRVVYGPVRAEDIPAFLAAGMEATPEMRRVRFDLKDRLVLVPMEFIPGLKYVVLLAALMALAGGFDRGGYSFGSVLGALAPAGLFCGIGLLAGAVLMPALLPWVPGRAFSGKGALLGLAAGVLALLCGGGPASPLAGAGCLLVGGALSSFLGMNFTGASTYTSLSGVEKEMRLALPLQGAGLALGFIAWTASGFLG